MDFISCILPWFVFVSYVWCLETNTKTFHIVKEHYDIASTSTITSQDVSTITSCGMLCSSDKRCLSFTACHENEYIRCRAFENNLETWNNTDFVSSAHCAYYEEYCGSLLKDRSSMRDQLVVFFAGLNISVPDNLLQNETKFSCNSLSEKQPRKNNLIEVIPKITKSWFVSFDVKRRASSVTPAKQDAVIFGFWGRQDNGTSLAYRLPKVWFNRGTFHITILLLVGTVGYEYTYGQDINTLKFTNFKVVQYQKHSGKYVYEIYLNEKKVFGVVNNDPREFEKVRVFSSTPWNVPCDCIIRNFIYSNLE